MATLLRPIHATLLSYPSKEREEVPQRMRDLASQIVELQNELDREIDKRRKILGWKVSDRIIQFEHGIVSEHRKLRKSTRSFLWTSSILNGITAPVIYSLIIPLLLLDGFMTVYQAICFRVYQIPHVKRSQYIAFDRRHLRYLNWIEALNCAYCGYANGLISYVREIAARTEQYWCPIKHALKINDPHQRYFDFLEFGDASGYRARLDEFRERLRVQEPAEPQVTDNLPVP